MITEKRGKNPIKDAPQQRHASAPVCRTDICSWPPRIFPHDPVLEGQPVPTWPEPYQRVAALDVDHKEYDLEHDNFVVKKGYVSEDGLIDDQSVVWDYENNKVTIKFRGGEPVVWDFWKPKDTADVLGPGHWCYQYIRRLYWQLEEAEEPGLFRRQ